MRKEAPATQPTSATRTNTLSELDDLRSGNNLRMERLVRKYRPRMVSQVIAWGGTEEEAREIFHEAFTAFFIKSRQDSFQLTCEFYTYLYAIAYNLWLKKINEKKRHNRVSLDHANGLIHDEDVQLTILRYERQQFFRKKLEELGEKCRELLVLAIVEEKSAEEMLDMLGFGSFQYLYKRKSNCKDKLVELIKNDKDFNQYVSW